MEKIRRNFRILRAQKKSGISSPLGPQMRRIEVQREPSFRGGEGTKKERKSGKGGAGKFRGHNLGVY